MTKTEAADPALAAYLSIVSSFTRGIVLIWEAEAAASPRFARAPGKTVESLSLTTHASHLLFAAALFDSFLSQTTVFLFLLDPGSMGPAQQVPLSALIDASARSQAITTAAHARALELSHLPFADRVQFLLDTFQLAMACTPDAAQNLDRFPSIQNVAAHRRGTVHLSLDNFGKVVASQAASPSFPGRVETEDLRPAIDSYEQTARALANAVFTQILRQGENPAVQLLLKGSTAMLDIVTA